MRTGKTSTDIVIGIVITAAIVVALFAMVLWDWSGEQGRKVYDYYAVPPYWI